MSRRIQGLDGCVPISGRVAQVLLSQFDDQKLRMRAQANDREVYASLVSLREAALEWLGSVGAEPAGSDRDASAELAPVLKKAQTDRVNTSQAAGLIGISERAIRKAIQEDRLPSEVRDGRHWIRRTDVEHYKASRAA